MTSSSKGDTNPAGPAVDWNRPTGHGPAPSLLSMDALINQAIPDALFVHDHDGRLIEVNDKACASTGYTQAELLGMNVCDLEEDFDLPAAQAEWIKIKPNARTRLRGHHRRKDGTTFPVEVNFGLLNYHGQRLYLGVVQDVTEREAARAALRVATEREMALQREKLLLTQKLLRQSEERYADLVASMSEGAVIQNAQGQIVSANPAAASILGMTHDQLMGKTSMDPAWRSVREDGTSWPGDEHPGMVSLATGVPLHNQVMGVGTVPDGLRWISINSHPLYSAGQTHPDGVLATFTDITAQKRVDDALRESNQMLEAVFTHSRIPIGVLSLVDERIVKVNRAFLDLFGYEEAEMAGARPGDLGMWPDSGRRAQVLNAVKAQVPVRDWPVAFRRKDGTTGEVNVTACTVTVNGKPCLISMMVDVTEARRDQAELNRLATTDTLTGLANRTNFFTLAGQELARARRYELPLSCLMLDLDYFKQVNDGHGHAAGDAVLVQLGARLRGLLRDIDIAGRVGGEEFAILLPQTEEAQALLVAERIRHAVAAEPFRHGALALPVTISIGVASFGAEPMDIDALLARADAGLYEAKRGGRDRVCVGTGHGRP